MRLLSIDSHTISLVTVKKNFVGQYETAVYKKTHQTNLIDVSGNAHVDIVASAITEAMSATPAGLSKEKDVYLLLPQDLFLFFKTEVPSDLQQQVIASFIEDKVRTLFKIDFSHYYYDYTWQENNQKRQLFCVLFDEKKAKQWQGIMQLLNLKLSALVPESLSYFSLFQQTLRKDKHEFFMYASLSPHELHGYVYDSFGPLEKPRFSASHTEKNTETVLKEIAQSFEKDGMKFNRLILSGSVSETIRQDTFTKAVGVWTNPLKRIIPQFYAEQLKQLFMSGEKKPFPYLEYDNCFGAFIFFQDHKQFSALRNAPKLPKKQRVPGKLIHLPLKEIAIGLISCIVSFGLFIAISKIPWGTVREQAKITTTVTPAPTTAPTPTAAPVVRKDFKIKVLNGSGIRGKASDAKDLLKSKGYEEILTGNADTFDFDTTVIQLKKDSPLSQILLQDISSVVTNPKTDTLVASEAADVVITVGKDWK